MTQLGFSLWLFVIKSKALSYQRSYMHPCVHHNIIYNSQNMKPPPLTSYWMVDNKKAAIAVVHTYILRNTGAKTWNLPFATDGWRYYAKWNESRLEDLSFSMILSYVEYKNKINDQTKRKTNTKRYRKYKLVVIRKVGGGRGWGQGSG